MPTTKVPIILLKTKSTPTDGYEEYFRSAQTLDGVGFEPAFVPVLEHRYNRENLGEVARLVRDGAFAGGGRGRTEEVWWVDIYEPASCRRVR